MQKLKISVVAHHLQRPNLAPSDFWFLKNERSTFFFLCQNSRCCVQLGQKETWSFLNGWNKKCIEHLGRLCCTGWKMKGHLLHFDICFTILFSLRTFLRLEMLLINPYKCCINAQCCVSYRVLIVPSTKCIWILYSVLVRMCMNSLRIKTSSMVNNWCNVLLLWIIYRKSYLTC